MTVATTAPSPLVVLGRVLRYAIKRKHGTVAAFIRESPFPASTVYANVIGEKLPRDSRLFEYEDLLGIPYGGLLNLSLCRWERAEALGVDEDLIEKARELSVLPVKVRPPADPAYEDLRRSARETH